MGLLGDIGGILGSVGNFFNQRQANDKADDMNDTNIANQVRFAQNGIQWRTADAKAAGIHPLYALGAQLPAFNPAPVNVGAADVGSIFDSMGQGLDRAIAAGSDQPKRNADLLSDLAVERARLENNLIADQIAIQRMNASRDAPPALPTAVPSAIPGQPQSGELIGMKTVPQEVAASMASAPHQAAAVRADTDFVNIGGGRFAPNPSKDTYGEDQDLTSPGVISWLLRNSVAPRIESLKEIFVPGNKYRTSTYNNPDHAPPKSLLPDGADRWSYNWWSNSWEPHYSKR